MQHEITSLTFLSDPTAYQCNNDQMCVRIPSSIHTEMELATVLIKELGISEYCKGASGMDWNLLFDELRFWDNWKTVPRRVVIIHQDVPLLQVDGWYSLKIYLETLIDSIIFQQEREPTEANPAPKRELVVIFPTQTYAELLAVLKHPPAWHLSMGFVKREFGITLDPSWPQVLHQLQLLNGVTAEVCWLSREDIGMMQVQYLKNKSGYYLHYSSPEQESELMASLDSTTAFAFPSVLTFSQTSQIVEVFFSNGERSSLVHWLPLSDKTYSPEAKFALSYFRSTEEEYVEKNNNTLYETISNGVADALSNGDQVFSVEYWKDLLAQQNVPLSQRLTALCIIGMSDLPDVLTLLGSFLDSPITEERWISARFLGMVHDEHALQVLLSMLTEEFPLKEGVSANDSWYEFWRPYAPRLLHFWPTSETTAYLREALIIWVKADPFFDQDLNIWSKYEKELCYELGYRGDFTALTGLIVDEGHRQELLRAMEHGARARRKCG